MFKNIREEMKINQWKNTKDTINWLKDIEEMKKITTTYDIKK